MKKLSIIIAIYNVEDYLIKCLDSLFNQTIKEGYEIICVNDGSTDKSRDIILEYVNKDKRLKLLKVPLILLVKITSPFIFTG